jgi:hypothetical protein
VALEPGGGEMSHGLAARREKGMGGGGGAIPTRGKVGWVAGTCGGMAAVTGA